MPDIGANVQHVREIIADAAARSGRDPAVITLIGVSKMQPLELIVEAAAAGVRCFGENRVQEAAEKIERARTLLGRSVTWHLIGTLQRNKVRQALDLFQMIQSVDSVRLADALAARAGERSVPVLLEVYLGTDEARPGFRPDKVDSALDQIAALPSLDVRGLMTIAPLGLDDAGTRAAFRQLRELRDRLRERHTSLALDHLSMGMTDDFALAIEEGATMVRVGRGIFGERN